MTSLKQIWANKNYRVSVIIALALVGWLASGLLVGSEDEDQPASAAVDQQISAMPQVRARSIRAQPYPLVVAVTGQTEANRFIDLRAEVDGPVEALPAEEGSRVNQGDVICRLAVEDRALRLAEAQAMAEQAQIDYDGALRLESDGFQSKTAIASAKSQLQSAKANLLRRELDLEKSAIRAPFAGVVEEISVEIGDLMRVGDTCATIIDLDPLVVSGEVSEDEVVRLTKDSVANIRLANGEKLEGTLRYISRRASEATRTFRVEAALDNPDMRLMSGITADLGIRVGTVAAHLISASLLSLDDKGKLGVRVLDDSRRVQFYNVDLVGDADNGVWVTGLPESTLLITVGQQYVGEGQEVSVNLEEDAAAMSTAP